LVTELRNGTQFHTQVLVGLLVADSSLPKQPLLAQTLATFGFAQQTQVILLANLSSVMTDTGLS
jgi:hypothetical protein